jgi:hypothetical protein
LPEEFHWEDNLLRGAMSHPMIRDARITRIILAMVLGVASSACRPHSVASATGGAGGGSPDETLAIAAGRRWAIDRPGAKRVGPTFVTVTTGPMIPPDRHTSAEQRRLLGAYAAGLGGQVVDSTELRRAARSGPDQQGLAPVQLLSVAVMGDTGYVTVMYGGATSQGTFEASYLRYVFLARNGSWQFVRRDYLGAS